MNRLVLYIYIYLIPSFFAKIQTFYWNITYVHNVSPDGSGVSRTVIGVNGHWPPPIIHVNLHDRVIIHVHNQLPKGVGTSLHTHGMFQRTTNWADGAVAITQCEIPSGGIFVYNFTVEQSGTYWIHSHVMAQYPDGLRSPFIIHRDVEPYTADHEYIITLSDWYHTPMSILKYEFNNLANPTGAENVPDSALINDSQNVTFSMIPGLTYRFRIINIAAFSSFYFWIEDHEMQIIEVDGIDTHPTSAPDGFIIGSAQRYSVIVKAKNSSNANFPIIASMNQELFDSIPKELNPNVTAWLVYNQSKPLPVARNVDKFPEFNDLSLVPLESLDADHLETEIVLGNDFETRKDGTNRALINGVSFEAPKIPTLFTVMSSGNLAENSIIYGRYTNNYVISYNKTVQIVINNYDSGNHPFHLHGHSFQVLGKFNEVPYNSSMSLNLKNPMRRDTLIVPGLSSAVIRFKSDNPGVWLFHCHIEWHVIAGLVAMIIEAPFEIQKSVTIPNESYQLCLSQNISIHGNAAGNKNNFFDLTGENKSPDPLPPGFTTKGYIAFTFCVISTIIGLFTIIWYALSNIENL